MKKIVIKIINFFKSLFNKESITVEKQEIKVNCKKNSNTTIQTNINISDGSDNIERK